MTLAESIIEQTALDRLRDLGYQVLPGTALEDERLSRANPVLPGRLRTALERINPHLSSDLVDEAARQILQPPTASTYENNRHFHHLLTHGIELETLQDGELRGDLAWAVDWDDPDANDWLVTYQLTIRGTRTSRRPDLLVYLNGLPIAVFELKDAANENATLENAWLQLQEYKESIPTLFDTNELLVVSDGLEARVGSLTAGFEWFGPWKSHEGEQPKPETRSKITLLLDGLFEQRRLLAYLRDYIFWDGSERQPTKKIAGYHQFYTVEKLVQKTIEAYQRDEDHRIGVVWHTQGSGKSVSMVFYAGKVVEEPALENPTLVILTDRIDLDGQLFGQFAGAPDLVPGPVQAGGRDDLRDKLAVASGGIVFTTLQKFGTPKGERMPTLSERRNVIVIADEAHRSHYEFAEGLAKNLRDALPNALYLGFTGTPIELTDRNTLDVFGDVIDAYPMSQAVADEATVPILYEARQDRIYALRGILEKIDHEVREVTQSLPDTEQERLEREETRLSALLGNKVAVEGVAEDLVEHWEERQKILRGKGLLVAPSRDVAVLLYDQLMKLRPEWHSPDDDEGRLKVVFSSGPGPAMLDPHLRTSRQTKEIERRFKDPDDPLDLVIVVDMWLTGFDVPPAHTIYLYKPIRGHTLMQAIARVNRRWGDKPSGLVVDYVGVGEALRRAIGQYGGYPGAPTAVPIEEKLEVLQERFEVVEAMFHGVDLDAYFEVPAEQRQDVLAAAADHVLGLDDGKSRFLDAVKALDLAAGMALHLDDARPLRERVALFQRIASVLRKQESLDLAQQRRRVPATVREQHRHAIRQIVAGALASDGVVDVFEAAGLPKPEVSILSEEFLAAAKNSPYTNLQIELLRRLLEDEIRVQQRQNVVQARKFSERLEDTLLKYRNRSIQGSQVILELIEIARQARDAPKRGEQWGLSPAEIAFYDALADHDGVQEAMGDEALAKIAHELTERIRKSVTIDWTEKETVRAKMRSMVKRILRRSGYPPDKAESAVETVLEQAATLARDWAERDDGTDEAPVRIIPGEHGAPTIAGANTKVVEIVTHQRAYDETPEEIAAALPHLTVAQVEAALEYYTVHRQEIDDDIERRLAEADRLRETMGQPAFAARLRKPN